MKKSNIIFIMLLVFFIAGCADVAPCVENCVEYRPYGFWAGLWHGWILFFSFIGSLLSDDIAVYAYNNNGGWYNFGFLLGAGGFSLGSGKAIKNN